MLLTKFEDFGRQWDSYEKYFPSRSRWQICARFCDITSRLEKLKPAVVGKSLLELYDRYIAPLPCKPLRGPWPESEMAIGARVHEDHLKKCTPQETILHTVEQFLDLHKDGNGKIFLLTRWLGFGDDATWEPLKIMAEDVPEITRIFLHNQSNHIA